MAPVAQTRRGIADARRRASRRLVVTLLAAAAAILAAAAPAPAAYTKYRGVQTHPLWSSSSVSDFDRELDLLKEAGGNAVRIDITWSSLETNQKGRYSSWYVDKIDTFMRHADERGIKVIPNFHAVPCWASTAPESAKRDCTGEWWERGVTKYPPRDAQEYARAAAYVAQRWGKYMAGLQIWNEPNESSKNFLNSPDQAADYVKIVKAAYPAVKEVAPNLTVAAGALSFSDGEFTERLYDLGIKGNFDVFSFHPYSEGRPATYEPPAGDSRKWSFAAGVPWIRQIMRAHGDEDKPIWLTEFGWTSCNDYDHKRCVTRDQQADYTHQIWKMIAGLPYVEAATQYNLRNKGDDPSDVEDQYGLVDRGFRPKEGYEAFKDALTDAYGDEHDPDVPVDIPELPVIDPNPDATDEPADRRAPWVVDLAAPRAARLSRADNVHARVRCPADQRRACWGRLFLRTARPQASWKGDLRTLTLGSRPFWIRPGETRNVIVPIADHRLSLTERPGGILTRARDTLREGSGVPLVSWRSFDLTRR